MHLCMYCIFLYLLEEMLLLTTTQSEIALSVHVTIFDTNPSFIIVCVYVCADAVPIFQRRQSQVLERCEPSSLHVRRGVCHPQCGTKKGESVWLLMHSDTITKKTLLSVLVSSKTPLQITQKSPLFVSPPNPRASGPRASKKEPDNAPASITINAKLTLY